MELELVPHVLYEVEDNGILWVKLNRPDRRNALLPDSAIKLVEYMRAGDDDPNVRVIVVTGVGKVFCAGIEMGGGGDGARQRPKGVDSWRQQFLYHTQVPFYNISQIRKPTIAMLNGAAVGTGMDIALHCDLRVGCENTRFFTYQNVGQIIENGGSYWLPHIVGLGRALELLYTGGFLMAERAYEWGVLNRLVYADKLEEETRALCDSIIKSPPMVQWVGKRIMRRALSSTLEATFELCAHSSGILVAAEDSVEARKAMMEKRPPVFKGL